MVQSTPTAMGTVPGQGTRDQIANIHWIIEKASEFQNNIYISFIDFTKAFDCVDHNKLWQILKEMWIPDHITCLLRNLYASQEATVRTRHGLMNWFKIGKGLYCHQAYLPYMQTTLCEMTGWMTHKLGSVLLGKILTTSDMHIIPL